MPSPRAVPFDAFLELLRAKGYAIGLHEYTATATLLRQWDRTHPAEFGDALAALVGRSETEVYGIRRLFDEVYAAPAPPAPLPVAGHPDPLPFWRRQAWALALIVALVPLLFVAAWMMRPVPPAPPDVIVDVPPIPEPRPGVVPVAVPPPPPPDLPPAPRELERGIAAQALAGTFLAALALFWSLKVREVRSAWLRDAWSTVRETLPGPYHYDEIVRDVPARLARSDIEDAATLLGRVFSRLAQAREIDVVRSLRATLRSGLLPVLLTKPRRVAETVWVVQDAGQDMYVWEPKIEAFLADLSRQGIALRRVFFDGDIARVSDRPHRFSGSFDSFLRGRPDAPVLIVSSGSGLAAALADPDEAWLRQLRDRSRTTWLTPVSDARLWPRAFDALPVAVWPMTRAGLLNAARQLAGIDVDTSPDARARLEADGRVTREDIERLKRLASLVPHPTPRLLNLLRHRYAADISDAAVLHLMLDAEGPAAPVIRLDDDAVRRYLNDVRRENPDLEAAVRKTVLDVLLDSEPPAGSVAHERWTIAVEVQRLLLADVAGPQVDTTGSFDAVQALARGPMWQEVQEALRLAPDAPGLAARASELTRSDRRTAGPPAGDERLAVAGRMPWSWPGLRELVPAALVAGLIFLGALSLDALPVRAIDHVRDAYTLTYAPAPSASTPRLTLEGRLQEAAIPRQVDLYRGESIFRQGLALAEGAPVDVQLGPQDTGSYFQVRATMPDGNLALSNAVWVTSDQLSFVAINALPWATVTISDGQTTTEPQQTPFTAALMPGTYQVTFENPEMTPPSSTQQSLTVPGPGGLNVTMPGFDPARAVDNLLGATAQ